jgi:diguanylate cyclase (GGDEF)-like protein
VVAAKGWLPLALALAAPASPPPTVAVDGSRHGQDLRAVLEVLPDPSGALRAEEVAARAEGWGPPPPALRGPGLACYWVRVRLSSRLAHDAAYVAVPERLWEHVSLHTPRPGGGFDEVASGDLVPLRARPYPHPTVALPLPLPAGSEATLYLRFRSDLGHYNPPFRVGLRLQPEADFFRDELRLHQLHGVYTGVILAMVLYNLFLYVSLRDRTYLLYVLYAGTFGAIWIVRSGLALEWVWPAAPGWNQVSTFYLLAASVVFGCLFVRSFLETSRHAPRLHRGMSLLLAGTALATLLGVSGRWPWAQSLLAGVGLLVCVAFVGAGIAAWRQGYAPARVYLAACGALIVGVVALIFAYFGVLGRTFVTLYGVQIGSAAEVVLLAFALGDRINRLRREKEDAQGRYQSSLEEEVRERTEDLAQEKGRLEVARQDAEAVNLRLREANERLAWLSRRDELTGLANRRHLEMVLDGEWRRSARTAQPVAVILIDVDRFKDYNDEFGHLAGDRCLQAVADSLAEGCQRGGDLAARYGGEEFLIVLPGADRDAASVIAERLRAAVEALRIPHASASPLPFVTVSAGVGSIRPRDGLSSAILLAAADAALYAAKRQGRNRVVAGPGAPGAPTTRRATAQRESREE